MAGFSSKLAQSMEKLANKLGGQATKPLPAGQMGPEAPRQRSTGQNLAVIGGKAAEGLTGKIQSIGRGEGKYTGAYVNAFKTNPRDPLAGASKTVGAIGGTVGNIAGAALGPEAKVVVDAMTKVGTALLDGADNLKKWNKELLGANTAFAEFSGAMTAVKERAEIREMQLSKSKGDTLAPSAEDLAVSSNQLDQALAPFENFFTEIQNDITTILNTVVADIVGPLGQGVEYVRGVYDWLRGRSDKEDNTGGKQAELWAARFGRPKRFESSGGDF